MTDRCVGDGQATVINRDEHRTSKKNDNLTSQFPHSGRIRSYNSEVCPGHTRRCCVCSQKWGGGEMKDGCAPPKRNSSPSPPPLPSALQCAIVPGFLFREFLEQARKTLPAAPRTEGAGSGVGGGRQIAVQHGWMPPARPRPALWPPCAVLRSRFPVRPRVCASPLRGATRQRIGLPILVFGISFIGIKYAV